jgi:NTP pyrophosphatase (non-canonical NTP hydrolase)
MTKEQEVEPGKIADGFIETFGEISKRVHQVAIEHGWWVEDRSGGECIALMHSELSEALEAMRNDYPMSEKLSGVSAVAEELADTVIRIMDYAEHTGIDLASAILLKIAYNKNRLYRHGGKKF